MASADITVIILTHNEALHIERAIASVRSIAARVLVVDSGSTDDTIERARRAGGDILHNDWVNHATQFNWALDHGDIRTGWVMRLDADEVIEPDLAARIAAELPLQPADVAGISFARKHIFMGRWIRYGGRYPLMLLRLWRAGQGRVENRWMDEHVAVGGGRVITMPGGFADHNLHDLSAFIAKHNGYATLEAIDRLDERYALGLSDTPEAAAMPQQAGLKRWLKQRVYNRLPLGVGPLAYFLYRMIFRLGFLDGRAGLIYHALQGFWYRFLVDAKVLELEGELGKAGCQTAAERRALLSALTGHKLTAPGDEA
ncbi:glycosyltransferase family 2 protein [Sphingomonas sp. GlSt437]|uniref:glycosyltransferase family 2 protein n=1 Tax=Sphingomonas sp. GlSt437 TaxID=3389970 RepID=UPI003A8A5A33